MYDKYETEIEQSLQDLAKTVTAACTQPPKFVQVVSSTRGLLIGHTEAGHTEIAEFMRDIGINNDRIRLRGSFIEITQDEAKSLGIDLAQHELSVEASKKLNDFANGEVANRRKSENKAKRGDSYIDFLPMDESIYSGTQAPIKHIGIPIPTIAARISPATRQIQIRFDMPLGDEHKQYFASQFQTLTDGQSVLFVVADDIYWLVTAEIVHDSVGSADVKADAAESMRLSSPPSKQDANDDLAVFDWSDLLRLLPESGTGLVMFSHEPDKREQMDYRSQRKLQRKPQSN